MKVLCQWNKGPPLSPALSSILSLHFSWRTARSPFAFVNGLLQYDILRCIQAVWGFSFLLWLYSMDGPLFAYVSMGIWVVLIVFHLETATLFSPVGTPSARFYHIVQVSSLFHSAHIFKFFFWAFCLFLVFHEPLRQCHERLIWGWAVNCHLQSAAWICMEVISRII